MRESVAPRRLACNLQQTFALHGSEMARVAVLKKNTEMLPEAIRADLRRYYYIRLLPIMFITIMIVVGLVANTLGGL